MTVNATTVDDIIFYIIKYKTEHALSVSCNYQVNCSKKNLNPDKTGISGFLNNMKVLHNATDMSVRTSKCFTSCQGQLDCVCSRSHTSQATISEIPTDLIMALFVLGYVA